MTRPGDRLRAFAVLWCCADTMTRLIDPLIADLQHEHAQAVRRGRVWRSGLIRVGGWIAFFKVIAICTWTSGLAWHRWTADERRMLVRAVGFSALLIVAMALLEMTPFMPNLRYWRSARLWLYLLPQAFPLSITIGATLGIICGVGGRAFSRRVTSGLVVLALTASVASLLNLGWIVPAANQAFRIAVAGRADLPKGAPELTLGELSQEIDLVERNQNGRAVYWYSTTWEGHVRELAFNYHNRWALSFSPLVFALLALSIAARGAFKRWMLAVAACGAFFSYYMLLYAGRELVLSGRMPAYMSAWSPNAVFTVIVAFVSLRRLGARADHEPAR
jgi:hypothetical protein